METINDKNVILNIYISLGKNNSEKLKQKKLLKKTNCNCENKIENLISYV